MQRNTHTLANRRPPSVPPRYAVDCGASPQRCSPPPPGGLEFVIKYRDWPARACKDIFFGFGFPIRSSGQTLFRESFVCESLCVFVVIKVSLTQKKTWALLSVGFCCSGIGPNTHFWSQISPGSLHQPALLKAPETCVNVWNSLESHLNDSDIWTKLYHFLSLLASQTLILSSVGKTLCVTVRTQLKTGQDTFAFKPSFSSLFWLLGWISLYLF